MPKMEADCVHGYDMGDGCPVCKSMPIIGKPFTFEMAVDLDDLTECGGIDGLNNLMDEFFWDKYGSGFMLSDISYKPVRINEDGTIVIQVSAADVEGDEDED